MNQRSVEFLQDTRLAAREEAEALRTALAAIVYARDLAPDVPIPTPLMLAIEHARLALK